MEGERGGRKEERVRGGTIVCVTFSIRYLARAQLCSVIFLISSLFAAITTSPAHTSLTN